MKTASFVQALGIVAVSVSWAVVFGWWAIVSFTGLMLLAFGVALERREVDG